MDFENILPLIVLWLIWVISKKRRVRGRPEKWAPQGLRPVPAPADMAQAGPPLPPTFSAAVETARRPGAAKGRPVLSKNKSVAAPPALPCPAADSFSAGELRQAVVWSEILAPPVALRNDVI